MIAFVVAGRSESKLRALVVGNSGSDVAISSLRRLRTSTTTNRSGSAASCRASRSARLAGVASCAIWVAMLATR
jgi:hypothetical protein